MYIWESIHSLSVTSAWHVNKKQNVLVKILAQDGGITFLSLSPQSRTDGKSSRKPV